MSNRKNKSRQWTFARVLVQEMDDMNIHLFERACQANAMAKLTFGKQQRIAYTLKADCLRQLVERGDVVVSVDLFRYPGLLSVGLKSGPRLHTHERWLYPNESNWRKTK